ncbi:MAG: hypothetical protein KIT17_17250, partial [Rubrivivax sp.]|nr:hypothetical protein [Rubrivivax sp.]
MQGSTEAGNDMADIAHGSSTAGTADTAHASGRLTMAGTAEAILALELRLHGYPAVLHGARPLPLKLRHALALLALLAEAPGPLGRAHLASLLWPDGGDAALVRARLRRLMHQANEALPLPLFEGDADTLRLRAGWRSDMQRTRAAMQAVHALAAAAPASPLQALAALDGP